MGSMSLVNRAVVLRNRSARETHLLKYSSE